MSQWYDSSLRSTPMSGVMRKLLFAASLLALLSGCAANGSQYQKELPAADNESVLYVYRPWAFIAGGYVAHIKVDDLPLCKLRNGGFCKLRVAPGKHTVRTVKHGFQDLGGEERSMTFETEGGKHFFIKYNVNGKLLPTGVTPLPVMGYSTLQLYAVPEEIAEKEIAELRESDQ